MCKAILLLLFLIISASAGAVSDSCKEITKLVVSLGNESDSGKRELIRYGLTKKLSSYSCGDCNLIAVCELWESPEKCSTGIRKAIEFSKNKVFDSSEAWVLFLAELLKFTDGEVSEELLVSFSYLLPENAELLVTILDSHEYLRRWTRSIVDPNPELKDMSWEVRCRYFDGIISKLSEKDDVFLSGSKAEVVRWASESSKLYSCSK
ncbi:hypothetical protein Maes01_01811 [Microbulbifer aestuariivivens]|uniref:HEAT repeat domain-containing protein n=1 Tax=Microbulbifer aestuariivivens TaxID=1908308 RepID=A0ABP9WS54_9GAMM